MTTTQTDAVTGAFGFSGHYIAKRLLDKGRKVVTLTNHPDDGSPLADRIQTHPLNFQDPDLLERSLSGVTVLYNTYWVRFNHKTFTFKEAEENSRKLFGAAKKAGVERIVHVSITNASEDSDLEYFYRKGRVERALKESGVSYAVLRPAVLFGPGGILINNIAFIYKKAPLFGVVGKGDYKIVPIHVDDFAQIAVEMGEKRENVVMDALGPEVFTYRELVEAIGKAVGKKRHIMNVSSTAALLAAGRIGKKVNDVVLTRDEVKGLTANMLYTDSPPVGKTRLTDWLRENADVLGEKYESELSRRL